MQSEMSPEPSSGSPGVNEDLPLTHYHRTSITKITVHLWQVVRRVIDFCTSVSELLRSEMFAFIGAGQNMTMTGELKKRSGLEALERPSRDGETKVVIELDDDESADDERESSVIDLDEEEDDDDEARLSEWESDEETEEEEEDDCEPEDEDTEWSDEDDEGDSEASAESLELWESFLSSGDPYNPLSFCSSIGSRTNSKQNLPPPPPPATRPEECESNPDSKEGGKKVCFSDQVTVRPLVAWSFASRAARDGSCWMQMARDRERFRRRAESIETLIKPCLTAEHREKHILVMHHTPD